MKKWRRLAIISFVVALIGLVGCFTFFEVFQTREEILKSQVPRPHIPKEGEDKTLRVYASKNYEQGIGGVEITLTDLETNETWTKYTDPDYGAYFKVIVGRSYMITATFYGSRKTTTFIVKPMTLVDILISENNVVEEMYIYEALII